MTLRDPILKKLAGSSGQNPVRLDDLRKVAEPICDDLQLLYDLMEQLYSEKVVNRASGFKDGKQYMAYWLTGSTQAYAPPFQPSLPPRQQIIRNVATPQQAAAKMQPAAKPVVSVLPTPTPQEKKMSAPNQLRATLFDKITSEPGIKQTEAVKFALSKHPDATERQAEKAISNMLHSAKKITVQGVRGERTLYPKTESAKPATSKAATAKPSKSKSKPRPTKKTVSKPALPAAPHRLPAVTTFDPEFSFAFGVRKDGGMSIFKEGKSIVLSSSEVKTIISHATN
jgi:hypothetical protein